MILFIILTQSVVNMRENSHKPYRGFHQAMNAQRTCFTSFIKLFLQEKDGKRSVHVKFDFFYENVNSHNFAESQSYHSFHFHAS